MCELAPTNITLGLLAGMTIFLGLPVARLKGASESLRGKLALGSAGVLLFLIIEVGYHAIETLEMTAKSGDMNMALLQGGILTIGLVLGLIGLGAIEENRHQAKSVGATPLEIANMIAIGIGLHNFAEGLAIGQSYSSGNASFGLILVLGFALHNATEGFGIAAPLTGANVPWSKLITLGFIAGGPTALGAALGGTFVNTNFELFILSLAVGSLIYVTRELLRLRFTALSTVEAMTALTLGLVIGIGTEIYIEVASAKSTAEQSVNHTGSRKISFEASDIDPAQITITRGEYIELENKSDKPLEIEAHGLMNKEAFIAKNSEVVVQITGVPGKYAISPEGSSLVAQVTVVPGKTNMQDDDMQKIIAALTILEGHVQAAFDLHNDSLIKNNPMATVDLARAKKHSYHPVHELFEDKTPMSLMVQSALQKVGMLDKLKDGLEKFSQLAGSSKNSDKDFVKGYADLLALVEKTRRLVGGEAYNKPEFKAKVALLTLAQAESEYKEAVETGEIVVLQAAQPGKDGYLEYQDTHGFLKAIRALLNGTGNKKCTKAQEIINDLLGSQLKDINPPDPKHPVPFKEIEEHFETIEKTLE